MIQIFGSQLTNGNYRVPVEKDDMDALIMSGAFDEFEPDRFVLNNKYYINIRKDKKYKPIFEKFTLKIKLEQEAEWLGSYISEHPLDRLPSTNFDDLKDNEVYTFAGIIKTFKEAKTKRGNSYGRICVETNDGALKYISVFNDYEKYKSIIKKLNSIIVIDGIYTEKYSSGYTTFNSKRIRTIEKRGTSNETTSDNDKNIVNQLEDAIKENEQNENKVIKQDIMPDMNDFTNLENLSDIF